VAHFIHDNVVEDKRGGYYNTWAKHTLKAHARGARRLYRAYNDDALYRVYRTRRSKTNIMSKNARNEMQTKYKNNVKMGIEVPRNTREALFFDKQNKNTLWVDWEDWMFSSFMPLFTNVTGRKDDNSHQCTWYSM
jgi:hypothetical protein